MFQIADRNKNITDLLPVITYSMGLRAHKFRRKSWDETIERYFTQIFEDRSGEEVFDQLSDKELADTLNHLMFLSGIYKVNNNYLTGLRDWVLNRLTLYTHEMVANDLWSIAHGVYKMPVVFTENPSHLKIIEDAIASRLLDFNISELKHILNSLAIHHKAQLYDSELPSQIIQRFGEVVYYMESQDLINLMYCLYLLRHGDSQIYERVLELIKQQFTLESKFIFVTKFSEKHLLCL